MSIPPLPQLVFRSLTPARWPDFETLMGPSGAYGGCWCMFWRLKSSEFSLGGVSNKRAMRSLVKGGTTPGLLAYAAGEPVGWVSVAPREEFGRVMRSPKLKPIDGRRTWAVNCFFVTRPFRRAGMMTELLKAAAAYARRRGAELVEGYPIEPRHDSIPPMYVYTGAAAAFRRAGFRKVRKKVDGRLVSRYVLVL